MTSATRAAQPTAKSTTSVRPTNPRISGLLHGRDVIFQAWVQRLYQGQIAVIEIAPHYGLRQAQESEDHDWGRGCGDGSESQRIDVVPQKLPGNHYIGVPRPLRAEKLAALAEQRAIRSLGPPAGRFS